MYNLGLHKIKFLQIILGRRWGIVGLLKCISLLELHSPILSFSFRRTLFIWNTMFWSSDVCVFDSFDSKYFFSIGGIGNKFPVQQNTPFSFREIGVSYPSYVVGGTERCTLNFAFHCIFSFLLQSYHYSNFHSCHAAAMIKKKNQKIAKFKVLLYQITISFNFSSEQLNVF